MSRVEDFRELRVYRAASSAAMRVFRTSASFPEDERYGMTSQVRRSSRSLAANVAEAWRKRRYPAAFVARLSDAEAEATETRCHRDFALGCGYIGRREPGSSREPPPLGRIAREAGGPDSEDRR